jgi:hypothetical protein
MCATHTPHAGVRWGALYAIVSSAVAVTTTIAIASPPGLWRVGAAVTVFAAVVLGVLRCLARQRVALDLSDWCDCAKSTVTIRIVESREPTRPEWTHDQAAHERRYAGGATARQPGLTRVAEPLRRRPHRNRLLGTTLDT